MRIIINGRSCTGKDTIGDYLVNTYGFEKVSFAEPIYKIARKYFGMKEKNRKLLIDIGDKMREIDPDVFVKYLLKNLKEDKDYAISDCRRGNEYKLCTEAGFLPIRVTSDLDLRIDRAIKRDGHYPNTALWEGHSETGADDFEYYEIENNGTLEDLYKKVDEYMIQLEGMKDRKDKHDKKLKWLKDNN